MRLTEDNLIKIETVILGDAVKARDDILTRLRLDSEQKLSGVKERIAREADLEYLESARQAESDRDSRISGAKIESRGAILRERESIIAEAFAAVTKKLAKFTQTEAYRDYLAQNVREALAGADYVNAPAEPECGVVLYLTPADYDLHGNMVGEIAPGLRVLEGDAGMIGGARAENAAAGLYVDNTLKKKAELRAGELYGICGLTFGIATGGKNG